MLVVNAHHLKTIPGRTIDVKDAEWIAPRLQHGLVRGSFVPPQDQRDLRDLTRHRQTLQTYLGDLFRRLSARRGKKKVVVTVGHSIVVIVDHGLTRHEPYRDLGVNSVDERDRAAVERRTICRLERLGYRVELTPAAVPGPTYFLRSPTVFGWLRQRPEMCPSPHHQLASERHLETA